jgi:hypothetical protein
MIAITRNKGFQMTFPNELTISVQIGNMNYCARKSMSTVYDAEMQMEIVKSPDAEIAIWNEKGDWFEFGNDTVKGWVPVAEVATWIERVTKATSINDLKQYKDEA